MKKPPSDFEDRLSRLFENRLRIRWSNHRDEWHIEYKVASGQQVNAPISDTDDQLIRARDGYAFILAVREGDRMPCPRCGYTLSVPKFEIAETTCQYCKLMGKDGRYPACYFPLEGDSLIQYLSRMDPKRTWRDGLAKKADAANDRLVKQHERKMANEIESITKDNFNRLVGIQQTGYTGKELK